ncbi:hypothetical protein [uncultured Pseudokineococcus sp.]|uniref:hypothetical protein n=1 Tax=uncultured Pseudokineococcus sp. TaxID=1642928 RepID=UPI00260FCBEE|nr:hypothetical protein [uncultured Pseudokineococcus sp.]
MSGGAGAERELGYIEMRLHVLSALALAVERRADLVDLVADAPDVGAAAAALGAWGLDDAQARAVLDLQVRRLAGRERERLEAERERLLARRAELGG